MTCCVEAHSAAALGAALTANSTLAALSIEAVSLWEDAHDAVALLAALQSHPSVRCISFDGNRAPAATAAAIGSALGALIAADAPALESLNFFWSQLGDAGMGPVVAALSRNTHLRVVNIDGGHMTEAFARAHLLPALRACTTVHTVRGLGYCDQHLFDSELGFAQELEQLLSPRRPAGAAR